MKNNLFKKLESIGGINRNPSCVKETQQIQASFSNIERMFESKIPQTYKDFYLNFGSFSFLESVYAKCIEEKSFTLRGNKVPVGFFYCIIGSEKNSVLDTLLIFEEQLPLGLLPICDGELGDVICVSLRTSDYGCIYYFDHDSPPEDDLLLIAKSFEDFMMNLEIYIKEHSSAKVVKATYSPEFLDLLKKSGYGTKD